MKKNYIIDTNILIDDPNCIKILINGNENNIFIPEIVIDEIDKLKRKPHLRQQIKDVVSSLNTFKNDITIFGDIVGNSPDNIILNNIINSKIDKPILITNDKLLRFKAYKKEITSQEYIKSIPFKTESEIYTGFIDNYDNDLINNCFYWDKGKLMFYRKQKQYTMDFESDIWKLKPLTKYQNACMMLLDNNKINIVTIQGGPGYGKTYISIAAALKLVFQKKKHKRIIIIKPNIEIGQELGYLPGNIDEKMEPYFKPIVKLLNKLHKLRQANKLWHQDSNNFNSKYIEMIPINFLRGVDIEDAVVIIDEVQNISRLELRTVLSRMGNNVKCICTGDIEQIDNKYLSKNNNGMNWMVKKFLDEPEYAHIVLKGKHSRGPIADLVIKKEL